MKANTSIILDNRKKKKDGTYPVKLRITHNRKQKYFPTKYSLTKEEFEKSRSLKPRGEFKDIALDLNSIEKKAVDVINSLPFFTWQMFDKHYSANRSSKTTLADAFDNYVQDLRVRGRIGTAVSYECAQHSLDTFFPNAKFADITPDGLQNYEKWMLESGKSITTVGIYLRSLRTLFNLAISEGAFTRELYPFGKRRYEIPMANNVKKAMTLEDISAIFSYEADLDSSRAIYKDYWCFMYLCFGINVKDMCLLKHGNIKDGLIEFERAKTARTKRKVERIRVPLTMEMQQIIRNRGNSRKSDDTYIFPILKKGLTPERERQLVQQVTHVINDHMKSIARELGITKIVTTYAARHSFATVLQRSGVSTDFISEALGHSSVKTTQNYLAGFEDKSRMEVAKLLTAFNGNKRA